MQVNLLAAFFFFTYLGCFAPEGFFMPLRWFVTKTHISFASSSVYDKSS